jgi:hypothetical protein
LKNYDANFQPFTYNSVETQAMAGYHAAYSDGFDGFFINPAGLIQKNDEIGIIELSLGFPSFDGFLSLYTGAMPVGTTTLAGPLALGYAGNGWGLGLFTTVSATNDVPTGALSIDAILPLGFAFRIGDDFLNLDIGLNIKVLGRAYGPAVGGMTNLNSFLTNLGAIPTLMAPNSKMWVGLGADLGMIFNLGPLAVGISATDFAVGNTMFSEGFAFNNTYFDNLSFYVPKLNIGVGFIPVRSDAFTLALALDYVDCLDLFLDPQTGAFKDPALINWDNVIYNLGLGLDMNVFNIVMLKAGVTQTSFGPFFSMDAYAGLTLKLFVVDLMVGVGMNIPTWAFNYAGVSLAVKF